MELIVAPTCDVEKAWKRGKVAELLIMDAKDAFDGILRNHCFAETRIATELGDMGRFLHE